MTAPPTAFDDVDVPQARTNAARQAAYRKADPARAMAVRTKYRRENSKWMTDAKYLSKPFIAYDGEGINLPDGSHIYTLFAAKALQDDIMYIENNNGLPSLQILRFIMEVKRRYMNAWHVIYGGSYDTNMWFSDMNERDLGRVYRAKFADWRGYRIQWRIGKSIYIKDVDANLGMTMYDTVSFFQRPFVDACDEYLGDRFIERETVVRNKALRGKFTTDDAATVRHYNAIELDNFLLLMYELRERLNAVGLRPARWDGPGAIAASLLKRERVKDAQTDCPPEVAQAARYAYSGGRFEVIRFGTTLKELP